MTDQPKKKGSDLLALIPKSGTAVAKFGDEQEVLLQLNIMRASVPGLSARKRTENNGRWVDTDEYVISDTEVLALFVASRNSGLRPDRGEIYVIPGQGVQVSAKIRASDAVTEASRWGNPLKIEYKQLRPGDPLWPTFASQYKIEKDDTVALCEVVSEKGYKAWRMARKDRAAELKEAGFIGIEMLQQLDHEYGMTPPPMRAIGIVKSPEKFDKGGYERDAAKAAEKAAVKEGIYSRYDRACKRAFTRFCNQHGFSAPDRRNYGGIAVAEEPAEDQAGAVISKGGAGLVIDMPKKAPTRKDIFGSGEDAPLVGFTPGVIDATPVEATAAPEAPAAEPEDEGDEPQGALPLSDPPKKKIKTPEEVKAAANTALAWADNVGKGFAKQHYAQAQQLMDAADWKLPKGTDMPAAFSEFKKWCAAQIAPAPEAAK